MMAGTGKIFMHLLIYIESIKISVNNHTIYACRITDELQLELLGAYIPAVVDGNTWEWEKRSLCA